jgi:hypothetical protein
MSIFSIATLEYPGERIHNPCNSKLGFQVDPTNSLQADDQGELLSLCFQGKIILGCIFIRVVKCKDIVLLL